MTFKLPDDKGFFSFLDCADCCPLPTIGCITPSDTEIPAQFINKPYEIRFSN